MSNNLPQLQGRCFTPLSPDRQGGVWLASSLATRIFHDTNKIMQNKPNYKNDQMNVTSLLTKAYENFRPFSRRKNKPNFMVSLSNPQTQFLTKNWLLFTNIGFVFHQTLL